MKPDRPMPFGSTVDFEPYPAWLCALLTVPAPGAPGIVCHPLGEWDDDLPPAE